MEFSHRTAEVFVQARGASSQVAKLQQRVGSARRGVARLATPTRTRSFWNPKRDGLLSGVLVWARMASAAWKGLRGHFRIARGTRKRIWRFGRGLRRKSRL